MTWHPASTAPENRVVLTRTGANLVFAARRGDRWTAATSLADMPAPREWLEEKEEPGAGNSFHTNTP